MGFLWNKQQRIDMGYLSVNMDKNRLEKFYEKLGKIKRSLHFNIGNTISD